MITLESPETVSPPSPTSFSPQNVTVFRVFSGSHRGRRLALRSRKILIGSSPFSQLRLVARGVLPRHCLVFRGTEHTVFRALGTPVTLNGTPARQGILIPGDVLGVGPVELVFEGPTDGEVPELRGAHQETSSDLTAAKQFEPVFASSEPVIEPTISVSGPATSITGSLTSVHCFAEPCGFVFYEETWSDAHPEIMLPQVGPANLADVPSNERADAAELDQVQSALERLERLADRLEEWHQTLAFHTHLPPAEDNFIRLKDFIDRRLRRLQRAIGKLHRAQRPAVEPEANPGERSTAFDVDGPWLSSSARSEPDGSTIVTHQASTDSEGDVVFHGQSTGDHAQETVAIDRRHCDETVGFLTEIQAPGPSQSLQGPEPESSDNLGEVTAPRGPVSEAATPNSAWPDEKIGGHGSSYSEAPSPGTSDLESSNPQSDVDSHQRTVSEYVENLLKRLRSARGEPAMAGENRSLPGETETESHEEFAAANRRTPGRRVPTSPPVKPRYGNRRRHQAPEKQIDLAALRELANLASQAAIDRYARAKVSRAQKGKLAVIITAVLCILGLLGISAFAPLGPLPKSAILINLIVILVYGLQYAILTGRLVVNSKGQLQLAQRRIGREMRKLVPPVRAPLGEDAEPSGSQRKPTSKPVVSYHKTVP